MSLPTRHPAHWPLAARLVVLALVALLCAASGTLLHLRPAQQALAQARAELQALRTRLPPALARAAALPALQAQHGALAMQVAAQAEQLWQPQDLPSLREKFNRRATECGLALASFRPLAKGAVGADVTLEGDFPAMRCLVRHSTQVPWPMQFERLDIGPRQADAPAPGALLLQATIRVTLAAQPPSASLPALHPSLRPSLHPALPGDAP